MPDLYIIKLGGSVITKKEENKFETRNKKIREIGLEIARAIREKGFNLIVVHGAGPFGHTNVTEFDINNGVYSKRQQKGYTKTVADCRHLNSVVVSELKSAGVNAFGLDPNKVVVQSGKKIVEFDLSEIKSALGKKVAVLYGQMVPDKKLNASVVSGDAIIAHLAKKFDVKKVFLGTDVAGIYTGDPKIDENAERIPLIDEKNLDLVLERVGEASTVDVTQGMKGKIIKLKEQLSKQEAFIFDMNKKENTYKALVGEKLEGTRIWF
ncbi:MAG: hypothetical protein JW772_03085 [Candidatus Diapherotrites archaeon]|nr:hypothetical protein [Candidatus Diapherotrites archaeon]